MNNSKDEIIWSLAEFAQKKKAVDFFEALSKTICVYSPGTRQLYSEYSVYWGSHSRDKLVIIPDFSEHLTNFERLELDAAHKTNIFLIPGEVYKKDGILMKIGSKVFPAGLGFRLASNHFKLKKGRPFCPIATRGDLREFKQSYPYLHLHQLDTHSIPNISEFYRRDLENHIVNRVDSFKQLESKSFASETP